MTPAPLHCTYQWNGHSEYAMAFGNGHARQIAIIPPLFDEMNRVRRMVVQSMRALDALDVGTMLIDLPGCGESQSALVDQNIDGWRDAVSAAVLQLGATHVAAIRGGCLIDDNTAPFPRWRLAPVKGASLLKTMIRTRIAGEKEAGNIISQSELLAMAERDPVELAGNRLCPAMVKQLGTAVAATHGRIAERDLGTNIIGSPLWLRAEPQDDAGMSASIADDLNRWSASCGG